MFSKDYCDPLSVDLHQRKERKEHLIFKSPRIDETDSQVFPQSIPLQQYEDRHEHLSQLAGAHRQDPTILHIRPNLTPQALRCGMPPQAAQRILSVHLPRHGDLPDWLDTVQSTFFNIEHLYVLSHSESPHTRRLRRLYILYRLPHLKSIDGRDVTVAERRLARPQDPNGKRVNRHEWIDETVTLHSASQSQSVDPVVCPMKCSSHTTVQTPSQQALHATSNSLMDDVMSEADMSPTWPRVQDYELDEGSSTAGCEWNAACGSLSFWRNPTRFRLELRKSPPSPTAIRNENERASTLPIHQAEPAPSMMLSQNIADMKHDAVMVAGLESYCRNNSTLRADRSKMSLSPNFSPLRSPTETHEETHTPTTSCATTPTYRDTATNVGFVERTVSLTSPFPLQFRARVTDPSPLEPLESTQPLPLQPCPRRARWKRHLVARTSSILPMDDDEDDDEDDEGKEELQDDDLSCDEYSI